MILNPFEISALGLILDDYEAPYSIASNIAQDMGRSVTEQEVLEALTALAFGGLATAFTYEESTQSYRATNTNDVKEKTNLWFMASPAGRAMAESFHD